MDGERPLAVHAVIAFWMSSRWIWVRYSPANVGMIVFRPEESLALIELSRWCDWCARYFTQKSSKSKSCFSPCGLSVWSVVLLSSQDWAQSL